MFFLRTKNAFLKAFTKVKNKNFHTVSNFILGMSYFTHIKVYLHQVNIKSTYISHGSLHEVSFTASPKITHTTSYFCRPKKKNKF